jgi:hypothetical protein
LIGYSDRVLGRDIPMEVQGRFMRCSVMIVALAIRRETGDRGPYVRRLRMLASAGYETVYLVGGAGADNVTFMRGIARDFIRESGWSEVDQRQYPVILHSRDGEDIRSHNWHQSLMTPSSSCCAPTCRASRHDRTCTAQARHPGSVPGSANSR